MGKRAPYRPLSKGVIADIMKNNPSVRSSAEAKAPQAPRAQTIRREAEFDSLSAVENTKEFLAFARSVISRYEGDQRRQEELEAETQDLLHVMELSKNLNASEGYKLYAKLASIRRERRACKNEVEMLKPLYEYLQDRRIINDLAQIQGKCSASRDVVSRRQYTLRTDVMRQ